MTMLQGYSMIGIFPYNISKETGILKIIMDLKWANSSVKIITSKVYRSDRKPLEHV
jgi:hypothetical protein